MDGDEIVTDAAPGKQKKAIMFPGHMTRGEKRVRMEAVL
jgi:hypothetical protein